MVQKISKSSDKTNGAAAILMEMKELNYHSGRKFQNSFPKTPLVSQNCLFD